MARLRARRRPARTGEVGAHGFQPEQEDEKATSPVGCGGRRVARLAGRSRRVGRGRLRVQQLFVPGLRRAGDVHGGRLRDARIGAGAGQEHGGDLPQEHRALFDRRADVLPDRLRPDVHRRRRRPDRLAEAALQSERTRALADQRRREGPGGRARRADEGRDRLFLDVRLVLPDGVRRHRGLDRLGRARRAHQGLALPGVRGRAYRRGLPGGRGLDLGLGLARGDGLLRFRRVHHRAFDRRLGGARRRPDPRRAKGKVRAGRAHQPAARREHSARDARHLRPLAGMVRLQRRLAAGARLGARRGRDVDRLRQHQPRRRRRRGGGDGADPDPLQEDRPDAHPQRRDRRAGGDHRGARTSRTT